MAGTSGHPWRPRPRCMQAWSQLGIERWGKRNAVNSGAESWTGISVVAGFGAVVLMRQGPHARNVDASERITLLQRLQEVRTVYKTCNQLTLLCGRKCQALLSVFYLCLSLPFLLWCVLESASHIQVVSGFSSHSSCAGLRLLCPTYSSSV